MNNHVMLDLETLSTAPNAAIIAIGAVRFDPLRGTINDTFYTRVDWESAILHGRVDAATVRWWMQQDVPARQEVTNPEEEVQLIETLNIFEAWLGNCDCLWGNGSDFDNVILASAYRSFDTEPPWSFRGNRCYRTLINECNPCNIPRVIPRVPHHALYDALAQAAHVIQIIEANKEGSCGKATTK